jgi:hypothetical protein
MPAAKQQEIPIQPVNKPILCSPFEEPGEHWQYKTDTGEAFRVSTRRPGAYWFKSRRTGTAQKEFGFVTEEESEPLPLVNALREDVRKWRDGGYENATQITKQLLRHWWSKDRTRRLFFCQLEAVETIIYLNEVLASGKKPRWKPALSIEDFHALRSGERPTGLELPPNQMVYPSLVDKPNEPEFPPLTRYGCKMATISGKTVVMAMLISWSFCNRGRVPGDTRFPDAVLVACPNLTIKERLQVLRPDNPDNYYEAFDLVPSSDLRELLRRGKVLVTNWHWFNPESPHSEGDRSFAVVNKGEESPEAFARNRLGEFYDRGPILVLNDEAHHAYRPAPVGPNEKLTAEERTEREEATVWISGLDTVSRKVDFHGCHHCELGLQTYVRRTVERLLAAIEPDDAKGDGSQQGNFAPGGLVESVEPFNCGESVGCLRGRQHDGLGVLRQFLHQPIGVFLCSTRPAVGREGFHLPPARRIPRHAIGIPPLTRPIDLRQDLFAVFGSLGPLAHFLPRIGRFLCQNCVGNSRITNSL